MTSQQTASRPSANPYDAIVYAAQPHHETAPDNLGALGLLLGLDPAPPERCRFLEIGCATGGNLFNLAEAYPGSQFIGLDPSARQIGIARQVADAFGFANLRFECLGAEALDDSWGKFDYIVSHGVYSWVPPAVREAILASSKRLLAPHSIAYVSYNAKPGFHLRQPVREMMIWHVRDIPDPMERVAQARAILSFLSENAPHKDSAWCHLLREEAELALPRTDFYLAHEHLEGVNEGFYFHEFLAAARRHGLEYLAEAAYHTNTNGLPPEARQAVEAMSEDLPALEQYVDFLKGRMFRRTLLVHPDAPVNRKPRPGILARLHFSGLAKPSVEVVPIGTPETVEFKNDEGGAVDTNRPVLKAALVELYERWPLAVSWDDLWMGTASKLSASGIEPTEEGRAVLASSLASLMLSNLVQFHAGPSPFVTHLSDTPKASRLARAQAVGDATVCNRRHRRTDLDGFGKLLLPLLDGTRDRDALILELLKHVDPSKATPEEARERIEADLGPSLERLAQTALLIG
ncbi:MAG: methyltransferase regulatory domain-containing protein [Gemmataceae bacterium]|nr:methyltransferase regulatory domain-containing protein [Gemmataceae bacterium]